MKMLFTYELFSAESAPNTGLCFLVPTKKSVLSAMYFKWDWEEAGGEARFVPVYWSMKCSVV